MHSEAGSEEWGKLSGQPASMPRCDRCIEFRPVVRSLFAVLTKGQGSPNPHPRSTVPMYLVPHVNRASSVARATFWHLAWAFALTVACRLAGWSLTPEVVVEISSRATWEDLGRSGVSGQPASQPASAAAPGAPIAQSLGDSSFLGAGSCRTVPNVLADLADLAG